MEPHAAPVAMTAEQEEGIRQQCVVPIGELVSTRDVMAALCPRPPPGSFHGPAAGGGGGV